MDGTTQQTPISQSQKQKNFRHLQTDTDQLAFRLVRQGYAANSLESRVPGGQAETIMRFGGTCADHKRWPLCRT